MVTSHVHAAYVHAPTAIATANTFAWFPMPQLSWCIGSFLDQNMLMFGGMTLLSMIPDRAPFATSLSTRNHTSIDSTPVTAAENGSAIELVASSATALPDGLAICVTLVSFADTGALPSFASTAGSGD